MSKVSDDLDLSDLPPRLRDLVPLLPEYSDDPALAELVSKYCFEVSPRTIETWAVPGVYLNGKVRRRPVDILREAWRRICAAPVRQRGRRSVTVGGVGRGLRRAQAGGPAPPLP